MMRFMVKAAATTSLLLLLPTGALADTASEVREAAKEAMALFEKGDMAGAAGQFDYAAQLIRQKKAGDLATLLPPGPIRLDGGSGGNRSHWHRHDGRWYPCQPHLSAG